MQFQRVVCVCTGNICRSPLAAGVLKKHVPGLTVSSAGIAAVEGGRMPDEAAAIAKHAALDLAEHRGRQITTPIVREADLILVMEKGQLDWIVSRFPETRGRVFMATHWVGGDDIADPYRQSAAFFERVYSQLDEGVRAWADRLQPSRGS